MLKKSLIRRFKSAGEPLVLLAVLAVLLLVPRKIVGDHTRLIWRGELTTASLAELQNLIEKHPHQYNVIQFRNSPGASAAAGIIIEQVETLINLHHLDTEVRGACSSACASSFLLGETRTMLPGLRREPTYLMLHATRQFKTREVDYSHTEKIFRKIAARSEGQFPMVLLESIFDDRKGTADGELYVFREARPSIAGPQHVFICRNAVMAVIDTCEPVVGIKPQDLGIHVGT